MHTISKQAQRAIQQIGEIVVDIRPDLNEKMNDEAIASAACIFARLVNTSHNAVPWTQALSIAFQSVNDNNADVLWAAISDAPLVEAACLLLLAAIKNGDSIPDFPAYWQAAIIIAVTGKEVI